MIIIKEELHFNYQKETKKFLLEKKIFFENKIDAMNKMLEREKEEEEEEERKKERRRKKSVQ